MSVHVVDARRLLCPMPVIRLQDRVASLAPGDRVEVLCTDPGALNDIPAWCRINGHQVEDVCDETGAQGRELRFTVRVVAGTGAI